MLSTGLQPEMSAVDRRRELNRLAAQKLRNRQKEKAVTVKQDYFAAQSRNTQLLYDVKQLRKQKVELTTQYEAHLSMCRHASTDVHNSQTVNHPASQTVCTGTLSQYAVITSGQTQQQVISPVLLLSSDGSGLLPPASIQLVSVAPLDANFADGVDINGVNSTTAVKRESDCVASETRLTNGDTAFCGENKDKMLNGVCKSNSVVGPGVSEVVPARAKTRAAAVVDVEKTVGGVSSVPASPVTRPAYNTRRRRSMSSLPHASEPAVRALKRATTRHVSSDQRLTETAAADSDNLPSFLSSMTDFDDE